MGTPSSSAEGARYRVEVCMGMGKTGMPRDPWDSHGNGNTISHGNGNGMGMGTRCMGMGIKTWEWEKNSPHTVTIASCAIHRNSWALNGS